MSNTERLEEIVKKAVQDALEPVVWDLQDTLRAFDEAADRLRDEWRAIDLERAEAARTARKTNGRASAP